MPTPQPATRREWLGLTVLMLPTVLLALDMTVLHLAAPHLSADLKPTSAELLWIALVGGVCCLPGPPPSVLLQPWRPLPPVRKC